MECEQIDYSVAIMVVAMCTAFLGMCWAAAWSRK
jgi:hypothetical protein